MLNRLQKISPEDKLAFGNLVLECQVLKVLLEERNKKANAMTAGILSKAGFSPNMYRLKFNISKDEWSAELKPSTLVDLTKPLEKNPLVLTGGRRF